MLDFCFASGSVLTIYYWYIWIQNLFGEFDYPTFESNSGIVLFLINFENLKQLQSHITQLTGQPLWVVWEPSNGTENTESFLKNNAISKNVMNCKILEILFNILCPIARLSDNPQKWYYTFWNPEDWGQGLFGKYYSISGVDLWAEQFAIKIVLDFWKYWGICQNLNFTQK